MIYAKYVLLIISLYFKIACAAQIKCDSLLWSPKVKLTSSDFKDIADTGRHMIAFTLSKFYYKVFPQEGEAIINTSAVFYPCKSWTNIANVKGSIAHEQLHFDITEYYRRLFLKNLSEVNTSTALLKTNIKNLFTQLALERRALDKLYDAATGFGEKKEEQIKWENKIKNMLLSLLAFEPQTITIKLQ